VIGQIVVDGNIRVSDSAFFSNLHLRKGDPYDEKTVRQEFRRLWDLDLSTTSPWRPGGEAAGPSTSSSTSAIGRWSGTSRTSG